MTEIIAWNEIGSPLQNPDLDKIEQIFKTSSQQTGLLGLAADTEYWTTSGSALTSFKIPPAITWDDWLDWAFDRWSTCTKDEVRSSEAEFMHHVIADLALLSDTMFIGESSAIKLAENFSGIKGQSYPLPSPESFEDPVDRARWHVFWNLDKCVQLARSGGCMIMRLT